MIEFKTPTGGSKWKCIADNYGIRSNGMSENKHEFSKGVVVNVEYTRAHLGQKVIISIHSYRTLGFCLFEMPVEQFNRCFEELEEEMT
jgi:hypothetical protein